MLQHNSVPAGRPELISAVRLAGHRRGRHCRARTVTDTTTATTADIDEILVSRGAVRSLGWQDAGRHVGPVGRPGVSFDSDIVRRRGIARRHECQMSPPRRRWHRHVRGTARGLTTAACGTPVRRREITRTPRQGRRGTRRRGDVPPAAVLSEAARGMPKVQLDARLSEPCRSPPPIGGACCQAAPAPVTSRRAGVLTCAVRGS
jgi:hypothetical protein